MTHHAAPLDPNGLPYHRLGLQPRPRWWRPLLVGMTAVLVYLAFAMFGVVAMVALNYEPSLDLADPAGLTFALGGIALMLPAALLAIGVAGRRPAGTLSSVTGHLRWRLVRLSVLVSAALMLPFVGLQWLVSPVAPTQQDAARVAVLLGIGVLLTPLQAAAEEFVFRGLLPQLIGGWLRNPVWAYTLPVALFTLGHLYDLPGLVAVAGFGLIAGWLTWRSGGLELATGLHTVNNLVALGLAAAGLSDPNATTVGWPDATASICYTALAALIMWKLAERSGSHARPRAYSGEQPSDGRRKDEPCPAPN